MLSQSAFSLQTDVLQTLADSLALLQQGELPVRGLSGIIRQHLQGSSPPLPRLHRYGCFLRRSFLVFMRFSWAQVTSCLLRWMRNIDDELHALIAGEARLFRLKPAGISAA